MCCQADRGRVRSLWVNAARAAGWVKSKLPPAQPQHSPGTSPAQSVIGGNTPSVTRN